MVWAQSDNAIDGRVGDEQMSIEIMRNFSSVVYGD